MEQKKTPHSQNPTTRHNQPLVQRKGGSGGFFGSSDKVKPFFAPSPQTVSQQKNNAETDDVQLANNENQTNDPKNIASDSTSPNDADSSNASNNSNTDNTNNNNITALQAKLFPVLQRVIQRDTAAATKLNKDNISAAMFNGTVVSSQKSGSVSLQDSGKNELQVKSPVIEIIVDAGLKPNIELDSGVSVEAGPIQTMTVSDRTGIYRHGGKGGEIMFQQRIVKPLSRDAAQNTDGGGYPPPPWYYRPQNPISQAQVRLHDEPWFALPKRLGNAVLTEIKGTSEFVSSIAVRIVGTDNLIHLYKFKWSVPWDMDIESKIDLNTLDEYFTASGSKGIIFNDKTAETPSALKDTKVANQVENAQWIVVPSISAAMQLHYKQLISNIIAARANGDTQTANNCIEALKAKNPNLQVTVYVNESKNPSDDVKITARSGDKSFTTDKKWIEDDNMARFDIPLLNVVDVNKMGSDTNINFLIEPIGKGTDWAFPWSSAGTRHFKESGVFALDYDYDVELKL